MRTPSRGAGEVARVHVLVVGSGGREYALGVALLRSPSVRRVSFTPGTDAMGVLGDVWRIPWTEPEEIAERVRAERVDLVVVGPEEPLAHGFADVLRARGIPVVGPGREGARLEASKVFAKELMREAGIPTAEFRVVEHISEAEDLLASGPYPLVIKADGLAQGKGVVVAGDEKEARAALGEMLEARRFGEAGSRVVVERFLEGVELTVHALVADNEAVLLPPVRDYKRLGTGDVGPNTGGMGGFSPLPGYGPAAEARVRAEVLDPLLAALDRRGISYRGILYLGLMWTAEGPHVLEFNVRFGDPEAQILLSRVAGDLGAVLSGLAEGRLRADALRFREERAVGVVVAAPGYPEAPVRGLPLPYPADPTLPVARGETPLLRVYYANVRAAEGVDFTRTRRGVFRSHDARLVSHGGRLLTVVGLGADWEEARRRAYAWAAPFREAGFFLREDVADEEHLRRYAERFSAV
ncbi:phosphoribosylamine--glycine ligase [Brockia lithotrophica]|uniref:Phosphoribosylamine--glycine ligase n=1 Tax=Brockia lithotrophica TaxID=933949 RepID=A0A660KWB5_9BACL|nr:phosphoribosylamine--glycine ligase [Brockia lithotrophica]RKQ84742.1 phosphoribosylamine--glycine ligase [Brockia lithotrophica]